MKNTDIATAPARATENVRKQTSFCAEMGQTCPKDAQIKWRFSSYKYAYLTILDPSIVLSGRGIIDVKPDNKGRNNYIVTEAAFKKIEAKYYTVLESYLD